MHSTLLLVTLAAFAAARTDLVGCQSYTQGPSLIWYVPGSCEACTILDCGGGRAPPKTDVPGCGLYSGTDTVSASYYPSCPGSPGTMSASTTTTSAAATTTSSTSTPSTVSSTSSTTVASTSSSSSTPTTTTTTTTTTKITTTSNTITTSATLVPTKSTTVVVGSSGKNSTTTTTKSGGSTTSSPSAAQGAGSAFAIDHLTQGMLAVLAVGLGYLL